jgi:hypothetical protein
MGDNGRWSLETLPPFSFGEWLLAGGRLGSRLLLALCATRSAEDATVVTVDEKGPRN